MKPPMPEFIRGDARNIPLPDASVDLIVCSPPYWSLRAYVDGGEAYQGQIGAEPTWQEYLDNLIDCTREWMRVLKPTGSCWVNLGDKYSGGGMGGHSTGLVGTRPQGEGNSYRKAKTNRPDKSLLLLPHRYAMRCIDELGLIVRQDQVWSKPSALPESVTDRTRRTHEYVFHLVKQPRYFAAVDEIRQPHAAKSLTHRGGGGSWGNERNPDNNWDDPKTRRPDPLGALPGSVWTIASQPLNVPAELGIDHHAAFPFALVRPIILGWSPREVCTACGEGRRPVAHTPRAADHVKQCAHEDQAAARGGLGATSTLKLSGGPLQKWRAQNPTTITGYVCACPDTSASATPGVVLDPFSGTGTSALVATMLGRRGIGVELSQDYIRLAEWRASDPKERARAAGLDPDDVAKLRPQLPGQLDMFGEGEAS